MRTKTLLLLAVTCGLAILVAGTVQLLRVGDKPTGRPDLAIGSAARAGDMTVTVLAARESDGVMTVELELGGVDDADALDSFSLVVPDARLAPSEGEGTCGPVARAPAVCTLGFRTGDRSAAIRVLIVERGEDRHRWDLRVGAATATT